MKKFLTKTIVAMSKFMLYGVIAQCLFLSLLFADNSLAQQKSLHDIRLSIEMRGSIMELFDKIENETSFQFSYNSEHFDRNQRINLISENLSLAEILEMVSREANLRFKRINKSIHVYRLESGEERIEDVTQSIMQSKTITGTVTAEDAPEGLPGVNVILKGTTTGTVTDVNGNYSIDVPAEESVLVFSSVGYVKEEVIVGNQAVINMVMIPDITSLEEIVVVGYGTQLREEVTGSISTVNSETIERIPSPNFEQALQGSSTGLQMVSSDGSPEGESRILIRGTGSVTSGSEPLILLDGVPIGYGGTSFLSQINPTDIESISVLKDASATAIYGSRGANGVILINTKSGKKGQQNFTFGYDYGVTQPINYIEMADADEWRTAMETAYSNKFPDETDARSQVIEEISNSLFNPNDIQRYRDENVYQNTNNDWFDRVVDNGNYQQYSFSASQGFDKASYFISGQYRDQEGNFINESYDRYQLRANLDFQPTDFIKTGLRYNFSFQEINKREKGNRTFQNGEFGRLNAGGFSDYNELYGGSLPVYPVNWPNSTDVFDPYSGFNIVHANSGNTQHIDEIKNNVGNLFLEVSPIKNLAIRGEFGINHNQVYNKKWVSDRARYNGVVSVPVTRTIQGQDGNTYEIEETMSVPLDSAIRWQGQNRIDEQHNDYTNFIYNATASYNFDLMENHSFSALVGFESIQDYSERYRSAYQGFPVFRDEVEDEMTFISEDAARTAHLDFRHEKGSNQKFLSYFGRLNYAFKDKYLAQVTFRRDGSSKFSPKNRFANFPSVSAGWILSEEDFFDFDPVNYLKLKSSWGRTGNADIGNFLFFNSYQSWPSYANEPAAIMTQLGSGKIQWELSNTFDVAMEFGAFNNRISGSIGYYNTKTTDMLLDVRLPASLGVYSNNATATSNVGSLRNQGIELQLNTINVDQGGFKWRTDINLTTNNNKIVSLSLGEFQENPARYSGIGYTAVLPDESIGTFFIPEFAGYDDEGFPQVRVIDQELAETEYQYEFLQTEAGQDSVVRATPQTVNDNRVLQRGKSGLPKFFGGITNTLSYKGLSLSFLLTFQGGNYIYDNVSGTSAGTAGSWLRAGILEDTWTPNNTDAEYRRLFWGPNDNDGNPVSDVSTKYLFKGDFLRLRNISLSYDLPKTLFENSPLGGVKVYMNMNNVATLSGFDRFDPEVVRTGDDTERNTAQGYISGTPPYFQMFTMTGGINVRF